MVISVVFFSSCNTSMNTRQRSLVVLIHVALAYIGLCLLDTVDQGSWSGTQ